MNTIRRTRCPAFLADRLCEWCAQPVTVGTPAYIEEDLTLFLDINRNKLWHAPCEPRRVTREQDITIGRIVQRWAERL